MLYLFFKLIYTFHHFSYHQFRAVKLIFCPGIIGIFVEYTCIHTFARARAHTHCPLYQKPLYTCIFIGRRHKCENGVNTGQERTTNIIKKKECNLCNFDRGMNTGTRYAGWVFQKLLIWYFYTQSSLVFTQNGLRSKKQCEHQYTC